MGKEIEMVNSYGYRSGTRDMFSKSFKTHGMEHLSTYLVTYKVGEYVDVVANGAIHKGMPHKYYHGKTGRVFNVTKRAIGVEVNKKVNGRIIRKRIHVRVEHVRKSKCRDDFLNRVKIAMAARRAVKAGDKKAKRLPTQPKAEKVVSLKNSPITITPLKYDPMY